jgi:hypothetical protein
MFPAFVAQHSFAELPQLSLAPAFADRDLCNDLCNLRGDSEAEKRSAFSEKHFWATKIGMVYPKKNRVITSRNK